VTRLLTGLARFVQHSVRDRIYLAHLAWAFFLLLAIVHFWWFEFGLQRIGVWTFEIYLFVICYAALFFFLVALLFPDRMDEYSGFRIFPFAAKMVLRAAGRAVPRRPHRHCHQGRRAFHRIRRRVPDPARRPRRLGLDRDVRHRPPLSRRLRRGRDRGGDLLDREPVRGAGVGAQSDMERPPILGRDRVLSVNLNECARDLSLKASDIFQI
jgi:hypothetical protein